MPNVFARSIFCIVTKTDFSLQPSHKDLKINITSLKDSQKEPHHLPDAMANVSQKITEKQEGFVQRWHCPVSMK